jgi:hypothetical protein
MATLQKLWKICSEGDYLNTGEYTPGKAHPWTTPASAHAHFLPLSLLQRQEETFVLVEELLPSRPDACMAIREAHLVPV